MQGEMHNEDDGLLRAEGYQFVYIACRKWGGRSLLAKLNGRIAAWNWSGRVIPPLHSSVMEGATGGKPSQGAHLRYTASQTVAFMRALPHLMAPLVEDATEPAWLSLKAHMHYFELKMARQFTDESIMQLEAATVDHQVSLPLQSNHTIFAYPPLAPPTPMCTHAGSSFERTWAGPLVGDLRGGRLRVLSLQPHQDSTHTPPPLHLPSLPCPIAAVLTCCPPPSQESSFDLHDFEDNCVQLIHDYLVQYHRYSEARNETEARALFSMGADPSPKATRVFDGCIIHHLVAVEGAHRGSRPSCSRRTLA